LRSTFLTGFLLSIGTVIAIGPVLAQVSDGQTPSVEQADPTSGPVYRPPLRGAPEGRVGGGSRSASAAATTLPNVELIAPANHSGFTADRQPTLYFFVSHPVQGPMQFTIRAPLRPSPVIEVTVPAPRTGGFYALPLSSYGVSLQPGVVYTWSLSVLLDPQSWSRNIVASAPIVCDPTLARSSPVAIDPAQRAAYFSEMGLWYDAITAAVELKRRGTNSAIAALLRQGGLAAIDANANVY
jgi:uncharacterized protein DUF928